MCGVDLETNAKLDFVQIGHGEMSVLLKIRQMGRQWANNNIITFVSFSVFKSECDRTNIHMSQPLVHASLTAAFPYF